VSLQATGEHELEEAVASLIQQSAAALIVSGDAMVYGQRAQIAELALKIPTSCPYRDQTAAGCLMSYGANVSETFRQAGNYVGRVLKGEKPADLPVHSRPNSSWSSISRQRRRSASTFGELGWTAGR
jgi:putative tryptophan/tyrosine transport system substrate-binding protein